ncbi:hypothetical protein HETIRDRAFT_434942 [Heterobasidion irregulare TC 32-1]|uniref:Uncharacterized protein n=1 Tax=Heterobasidion irregulare (strain TC 32-1) TaxID=747525 RepID=W4K5U0_HETIT|nr:uncharacterized protein HETIRDRAFT_434942 [Heterobasidion irregulare TC 32-1]ETW81183.1 hypothetical protein HETIRDRAFT_434942 [Heterobasidion irregulare TC 32-1]
MIDHEQAPACSDPSCREPPLLDLPWPPARIFLSSLPDQDTVHLPAFKQPTMLHLVGLTDAEFWNADLGTGAALVAVLQLVAVPTTTALRAQTATRSYMHRPTIEVSDLVILNITPEATALRRAVLRDVLTPFKIAVMAAKSIISYFRSAKQRCISLVGMNGWSPHCARIQTQGQSACPDDSAGIYRYRSTPATPTCPARGRKLEVEIISDPRKHTSGLVEVLTMLNQTVYVFGHGKNVVVGGPIWSTDDEGGHHL